MDPSMEDSGIDSDQKSLTNGYQPQLAPAKPNTYSAFKKTSDLQKKIERQRDVARRSTSIPNDLQVKKTGFVSRSRLTVPSSNTRVTQKDIDISASDQQPLVAIMSDDSSEEDEFDMPRLPKAAQKEIKEQLIKDGYNLDLEPDDEDLDLIPPRPLEERCACCSIPVSCSIQ